jgi:hypothetical protein
VLCFSDAGEVSLWGDDASTIIGRSIVIHRNDNTRFACANIVWAWDEAPPKTSSARAASRVTQLVVLLLVALSLA